MTPSNSVLEKRSHFKNTPILEYKKGIFSLFRNVFSLGKYCVEHKIDIIHGHDSHAHTLLWLAYRFGRLQTKSVVTRRLMNPIKKRSLKKYNFTKIEKIICISEAVKKVLISNIKDPSRLTVIHSAVKTTMTTNSFKKDTSKKEFVIGYVAAFTEEKDHDTFLATAEYLTTQYPDGRFKFLLVGNGPLLSKIKEQSSGINTQFEFTGFVEDVEKAYSRMDLLLHTSKSEALGTSILDAMKFGIPVVATNTGGIPEIIAHGENGFLCNPGDYRAMAKKINEISSNVDFRDKFMRNAPLKLAHFDVNIMVNKTYELYQGLLTS
jgi:glycosyltransferase involved in cell wall biosynthesis